MSDVEVHLPPTLRPLFPGMTRTERVDAATVDDALQQLEKRYPGLRDRVCEPGPRLRPHINVYVNRERGDLTSPLPPQARVDVIAAISGG